MGDDGDGKGCAGAQVAATQNGQKPSDTNASDVTPQETNVNAQQGSLLAFLVSPPQQRYVANDTPLSDNAKRIGQGVASNQNVQFVSTVADCAASQVPFLEDGKVPVGPALVAAGQPWIPTAGKFAGATGGTSVASVVSRTLLPFNVRLPALTNAGLRATPKLGGFVGRAVPLVGWAWTAYSIGSCVAQGPR